MNRNPYAPPEANVVAAPQVRKLYSPLQVFWGCWLGGPMAMVYFLRENALALSNPQQARHVLVWGGAFNAFLIGILLFLSSRFPNFLIPLVYCVVARFFVETRQKKKIDIVNSDMFAFQSNRRVWGIGLLFAAIFLSVLICVMVALEWAGIQIPDQG